MRLTSLQRLDLSIGNILLFVLKPVVMLLGRILRRDHLLDVRGPMLAIKLQGGGSLVLAYPGLLGIRKRHRGVRFILLCTRETRVYSELLGIFDEFVEIDTRSPPSILITSLRAIWALRGIDTVIDLEIHSRLTTVFAALTLARNRIGFYTESAHWRIGLATHLLFLNLNSGVYIFYQHLARLLDAVPANRDQCREHLLTTLRQTMTQNPEAPQTAHPRIGLVCLCSELGRERMLTPEQWVVLLKSRIDAKVFNLTIFGSGREFIQAEPFARVIAAAFPSAQVENACLPRSLSASLSCLSTMDEIWSIDSGLLHFARLLGIPTRSFWGPTAPSTRLDPAWNSDLEIVYIPLPCSPCIHVAEASPCRGNNLCMRQITDPLREERRDPLWIVERMKP